MEKMIELSKFGLSAGFGAMLFPAAGVSPLLGAGLGVVSQVLWKGIRKVHDWIQTSRFFQEHPKLYALAKSFVPCTVFLLMIPGLGKFALFTSIAIFSSAGSNLLVDVLRALCPSRVTHHRLQSN